MNIKQQIKPLDKSKAYVVVEYLQSRVNQKFQKKIQSKYGEPDIIWNYNDENRTFTRDEIDTNNKILVYDNPEIYKRISRKSKKFKRECNKASPNYRVRWEPLNAWNKKVYLAEAIACHRLLLSHPFKGSKAQTIEKQRGDQPSYQYC